MSTNTNGTTTVNLGCGTFASLLTILFIGLKLTGHVDWSWVWVLSPLWISTAFGLLILAVVLAIFVIAEVQR